MKPRIHPLILCLCFLTSALSHEAVAQTTAFTYQGTLTDGAAPASGLHDFEFQLYDAASGGTQQGSTATMQDVTVAAGLFTVSLDFGGGIFDGGERWLEIAVRPGASTGAFTRLTPRQRITSTPYAIRAAEASAVPAGSISAAMLADGSVTGSKIAPGAVSQLGSPNGVIPAALQVNQAGLVGVGTGSPGAGLHVSAGRWFLNPELLSVVVDGDGPFTTLRNASSIAVSGNLAAVAAPGDSGITLLDVTVPSNPLLIAQLRDGSGGFDFLEGVSQIAMKPGLLVAASPLESAVTLIDVSNPAAPFVRSVLRDGVAGWNELGGARDVAMRGDLLAIAAGTDSAVTLVDISLPAVPIKLVEMKDGQFGFNRLGGAICVAIDDISGDLLVIGAEADNAVTLVDVAIPASPVKRSEIVDNTGGFNSLGGVRDVAVLGQHLAIAAFGESAVTLVDIQNRAVPVKRHEWIQGVNSQSMGGASSVSMPGGGLIVVSAMNSNTVSLINASVPLSPVLLAELKWMERGFHQMEGPASAIWAGADLLLVAGSHSSALSIIELKDREAGIVSDGFLGIGTDAPAAALHVVGDTIVESAGLVDLNASRFEAGIGTQAIGNQSTALGYYTAARGFAATALGSGSSASGPSSTALGLQTSAGGASSTAMGYKADASGDYSLATGSETVAGGYAATTTGRLTNAAGYASTAMGYRAKALHNGSFVWADQQNADFESTAPNQFSLRASGGMRLSNDTSLSFGSQTRQMINLWNASYGIGVQSDTAYFRTGNDFAWFREGSHSDAATDPGPGGGVLMRLTRDGKLGVGGIAPTYPLEVTSAQAVGRFTTSGSTNGSVISLRNTTASPTYLGAINFESSGGTPGQIAYLASDRMAFRAGDVERMSLNASGLTVNGTFVSASDRNVKENFAPADARAVLEKVAALPVSEWNYKDDPGTRHIGPMAQDFHAAFHVGPDDKHIATVDADGVALAAIKGLNEKLEAELQSRDARIAELEERLAALEALLKK